MKKSIFIILFIIELLMALIMTAWMFADVGAVIYLISPLLRMRVSDFIKELLPFIGVTIAVILVMVFLPGVVTLIPNLLYG